MNRTTTTFSNEDVANVFASYPSKIADKLIGLRDLIYQIAEETPGVGELDETLRWGEPSYIPGKPKSGSMVRLGWKASEPNQYRLLFLCQTSLVASFRERYPDSLHYEGKRAIVFNADETIPTDAVTSCIRDAFTYYL